MFSQRFRKFVFSGVLTTVIGLTAIPQRGNAFLCLLGNPYNQTGCVLYGLLFLPFFGAGLILLDGKDPGAAPATRFSPVTERQADQLRLSRQERVAYRAERSELNAALDQLQATQAADPRVTPEQVQRNWEDATANLSRDAVAAAEKILAAADSRITRSRRQ